MERGRELSYKALLLMEGQDVIVQDCTNDVYDQVCIVNLEHRYYFNKKMRQVWFIAGIRLENEEYIFQYNDRGECVDGEFRVYSCGK